MIPTIGVTKLVYQYMPAFDRVGIADRIAANQGTTREAIFADWDAKRTAGRERGESVHKFVENFMQSESDSDEVMASLHTRAERAGYKFSEWLRPEHRGYCKQFLSWWNTSGQRKLVGFEGAETEAPLRHNQALITGKADLLVNNNPLSPVAIVDFKTTGKFSMNKEDRMLPPFEHLKASSV